MIKQFFKFSTFLLLTLFTFIACDNSDDDEPLPKGDYEKGYFIANEGNFGSPNASVSFLSKDFNFSEASLFKKVNNTALGDVLQDIAFDEDYAYLVLNNSNKIEVVNRYTFKSVATITENISLPRYALVENGKLYVSNSKTQSIGVYDTSDFSFVSTIDIGSTVEQIEADNNYLYIQNAAFGTGNTITVVNLKDNSIVKTITTGDKLNSIDEENGILYALHGEGITKINTSTNESAGEIPFKEGLENASKIDVENNDIYFIGGSNIYKFNKDVTELTNTPLVDTKIEDKSWFIGYGFSVINDKMFYTDVNGFTENSEVLIYDTDGKLIKTVSSEGIGANSVFEND
ncbi:MAG: hypothetical protein CR989_00660 [Flavobacteriales bacterium]|nr:MAG: hypothetical protein CR989_00660 [Flavobacteriales bacterium]